MYGFRIGRFGKLIGMAVGVTASGVLVAHCSTTWNSVNPAGMNEGFPKWDYNWDRREPYSMIRQAKTKRSESEDASEAEKNNQLQMGKNKCKAIRHIILIRHGQYNLKGASDFERSLTALGESQAELTGQRLKTLGINFTSLISSNMMRAIQSAQIISKNLLQQELDTCKRDPLLREGAPVLPEPPVANWHPDLHQYYEDGARIEAAFRKYFHRADPEQTEDSYEIIVCHANVIRYFVCRAMQFPCEAWLRISLNHASLTCLSILPSGRVILRALGDSGHLPPDQLTTS